MEPVIEARQLRRTFGSIEALRGIDFSVARGEIVGLLGPNGAGKTTTMKLLTSWLAPTSGSATVCGCDVLTDPIGVRRAVGYLPEGAPAHAEQRVCDWLSFAGELHGLGRSERARAMERVASDCGLVERMDQHIGTLSRGFRQRVGLATALLHEPRVLILDEPTTGLDPNQVTGIRELIRRLGETRTVILSTHILGEVTATCDRVLILHEGELVADDSVQALAKAGGRQVLHLAIGAGKVVASAERLAAELAGIEGVESVHVEASTDAQHRFAIAARADVREAVYRWAVAGGHVLVELTVEQRDLEAIFRDLTVGSA